VLGVRRQGVGGHHPAPLRRDLRRHVELVVTAVLRELEGDQRQLLVGLVAGISAIDNAQFYVRDVEFVFADLQTFGWILTVVGALQLLVAVGIFTGSDAARWAGIAFAGLNMILQFFFLPAYPFGSIMIFFVDVIVIWGLLMYGGSDRRSLRG
jgi:hypothetical protein